MTELKHLMSPYALGDVQLANRAVMGPMTRSRAIGNVPNELMAEYYAQRASAGLILTEGTAPSANGLGYPRIPGLFNAAQVAGWKLVTQAAHEAGSKIFVQLMHVGRIAHPLNMPAGATIVAPSAIAAAGEMYTDQEGPKPHPAPEAMDEAQVEAAIEEFVQASRNAIDAGFDGVELHGANGYLIDQFLNPKSNQRDDAWGGSPETRNRFALECAKRCADAIGKGRVGIRLSPYGVFNDVAPFDGIDGQYAALAEGLKAVGIAYVHIVDHEAMGAPPVPNTVKKAIREGFGGTLILSGGYDGKRAEADLTAGKGELVAFSRPFLANPDLLERYAKDAPLQDPKPDLFYSPGREGYTDYPTLSEG